jgi:hypothetical protein
MSDNAVVVESVDCSTLRRAIDAALPKLWIASAATTFAWFRELRHDDAFITFRYARNIAEGAGFVFNPGEHVLGTTSPLFTLVAAGLYVLVGEALPTAAIAVNAVAVVCQAALVYLLLRDAAPVAAFVVSLCVAHGAAKNRRVTSMARKWSCVRCGRLRAPRSDFAERRQGNSTTPGCHPLPNVVQSMT